MTNDVRVKLQQLASRLEAYANADGAPATSVLLAAACRELDEALAGEPGDKTFDQLLDQYEELARRGGPEHQGSKSALREALRRAAQTSPPAAPRVVGHGLLLNSPEGPVLCGLGNCAVSDGEAIVVELYEAGRHGRVLGKGTLISVAGKPVVGLLRDVMLEGRGAYVEVDLVRVVGARGDDTRSFE